MSRVNLGIFQRKKIVHSKGLKPATFLYYHKKNVKGKEMKLVRVGFENLVKVEGTLPITDILLENVTMVITVPSEFDKWIYSLALARPKKKVYVFRNGKAYRLKNPRPASC